MKLPEAGSQGSLKFVRGFCFWTQGFGWGKDLRGSSPHFTEGGTEAPRGGRGLRSDSEAVEDLGREPGSSSVLKEAIFLTYLS